MRQPELCESAQPGWCYLTPRTNLEQQNRRALLAAEVPKLALGGLIGCSLAYTVLGIALVIATYRVSRDNVTLIAEQLSLDGSPTWLLARRRMGHRVRQSVQAAVMTAEAGSTTRTILHGCWEGKQGESESLAQISESGFELHTITDRRQSPRYFHEPCVTVTSSKLKQAEGFPSGQLSSSIPPLQTREANGTFDTVAQTWIRLV